MRHVPQVSLENESLAEPFVLTNSNFRYLYWNVKQQLAHGRQCAGSSRHLDERLSAAA